MRKNRLPIVRKRMDHLEMRMISLIKRINILRWLKQLAESKYRSYVKARDADNMNVWDALIACIAKAIKKIRKRFEPLELEYSRLQRSLLWN